MYRQQLRVIAREAHFPVSDYGEDHFLLTASMVGELRELDYLERWRTALARRWYHVKMQDHSLFLFAEGTAASYSFLQCPIDVMSFPEYLRDIGEGDTPQSRREFQSKYQEVLDTASPRRYVTPIRFDYDTNGYRTGVHPVAHIHIGLGNDVRLCSNRMNAVSFVLFVMRHVYPQSWEYLLSRKQKTSLVSSIRALSTKLSAEFWKDDDRVELYFT